MGYIKERVSYLKGLAEGMEISDKSKEGKLISALIEVLDDVVDSVELNEMSIDELNESVDAMSEDVEQLEDVIFDEDDEDDYCDDDCEECDCDECEALGHGGVNEDGKGIDFAEFTCPNCGDTISFDPDYIDCVKTLNCPNCGQPLSK